MPSCWHSADDQERRQVDALEPPVVVVNESLGVTPTPDDGRRLSTTRLWDEEARPSGPPTAADAVYTPAGRAGSQQLIDVHDHLRAELARVRALVKQVLAGARRRRHAVGDQHDDLLTDTLLSHLSYEERELVEPLARMPIRY
jgi:hypothetical protein